MGEYTRKFTGNKFTLRELLSFVLEYAKFKSY